MEGQTSVPTGLNGVTAIAAGGFHTVALTSDATVVAWGRNMEGQTTVPAGLSGVTAIAGGDLHTVALVANGAPSALSLSPSSVAENQAAGARHDGGQLHDYRHGCGRQPHV